LAECTRRIDASVLEAAEAWGSHLVYASGCSLYDPCDPQPKVEASSVVGRTPYLTAKLAGERAAARLPKVCIARLSAPVGPGIDPRAVIARFVEGARAQQPIEVWGTGLREQDFVASADVAEFVVAAIERTTNGIYNVASGRPTTMLKLAKAICDKFGMGDIRLGTRPDPLDGATARFSIAAAETAIGWRPKTTLSEMIPEHGFELRVA
jgi:nucleoside-diphosphate-sugar epimerase